MFKRISAALLTLTSLFGAPDAAAMDDAALAKVLEQRLSGDRSGACVAAAVIAADGTLSKAIGCADPSTQRGLTVDTAFEIGSVSKTVLALLIQQQIDAGQLGLDDALQQHLPKDVQAPEFEGAAITLRHLLTHTSGLPSLAPAWRELDPANPYAALDSAALHAGLVSVRLTRAPGSQFEYSNLGAMLLSDVLSRGAGMTFAELAAERVFEPLAMRSSEAGRSSLGDTAQGHRPGGEAVPGWRFDPALAGVGGVRASLDDMAAYVQAQMGLRASPLAARIARSQAPIHSAGGRPMAMGWMIAPLNGQSVLVHEGGTGGFSSFVAFRADHTRGVVLLADTALTSLGGLGSLGLHLLDSSVPLGVPRTAQAAPEALLKALVGDCQMQGGMRMSLSRAGAALKAQAEGQPAFLMGYDSSGEFYPLAFDAALRPALQDGRASFLWMQGGAAVPATRIDSAAAESAEPAKPLTLADYVGTYPLMKNFALKVFVEQEKLMAQASGQGAFEVQRGEADTFRADAFGIVIRFSRDAAGRVDRLALHQAGQIFGSIAFGVERALA